ncbi:hypothetical protein [Nocardiopsis sp. CNT312]|uniref:hypothetical protein n=1 Tax=Nocardiopsis sp. CNT312 TaxID=1137268 RepID=UPI0004BAC5E0|nr:hypothetical protein [Nocardiopsis sp. CNT312]
MEESQERKGAASETGRHAPTPRTPFEVIERMLRQECAEPDPAAMDSDPGAGWERHVPAKEEFGDIRGFQRQGGGIAPTMHHRGRPMSWVSVALAFAGFALGGLSVVLGWSLWPLVLAAVLITAAFVVAVVWDILADVVLDPPRTETEERHDTPLHRIKDNLAARGGKGGKSKTPEERGERTGGDVPA